MSESAVKLFGWTMPSLFLPLSSTKDTSSSSSSSSSPPLMVNDGFVSDKSELDSKSIEISSDFEPKEVSENNSDQQSEITTTTSTTSEDKTINLKKPEKILPCPRCKSADTKFCYYNNYNVNQPRYFCRNCQRYWTAGGSMRSVPVGSGRRKNKGWASSDHNYLHINSENTKNSSQILTFGSSNSSISEDTKITTESSSPQGFLPQQVTFPVSSPWPNQQWSTTSTAGFYPMPVYWACTVPFWPTQETATSTSLGKRTRDQTSDESESIDDELRLGSKNHVWSPVAMRRENKERLSFFNGIETKSSNRRVMVPENAYNLQANPAAMARSMSFRERM